MNNKTHDTNARTATSTDADVVQKYPGLAQRSEDDSLSASKPLPEHLRDAEQTEESESATPSRSFSAERDPTQQKLTPTAKPAGGPIAQRDEQRDKPAKKPRLRFSRPTKDKTEKTDRTVADQTVVELPHCHTADEKTTETHGDLFGRGPRTRSGCHCRAVLFAHFGDQEY